ncbi:MAG TPA: PEP-CTERM sorting domain-containing protein [Candidatus Sulfotelmatobacter sp.]
MTPGKPENVELAPRRRRSRRHRRNRMLRHALFLATIGVFTAGLSAVALHYLSPSLFRASQTEGPSVTEAEDSRSRLLQANGETFAPAAARLVYPYSVVRGGVEDARELKWVAEHDPVVAAHYAGFDYDHAQVVRLALAQTVFLSYRIGNHVYWTRHRVSLHKGEKLLTDGKMTARTKCGNRVETVPQQEASAAEPPAAKFEEPIAGGEGTAMHDPPVSFQSALMNRPGAPGIGPAPPLSLYSPFAGEAWIPIAPPPLPLAGVCAPGKKKGVATATAGTSKKQKDPCGPPESVPEPASWLFMATGLAGISFWRMRGKLASLFAPARI